jgi:ferritin-like metal-binding protein YciE
MAETSVEVIKRYLEDAIAAEKSFETQLQGFSKEGDDSAAQAVFHQHALETKQQYERLTARLEALGGSPSGAKSFLAHVFGLSPKAAQIGHEKEERTTQNLMMAYAVENSEVAMYESLACSAEAAGDTETAALARQIQQQERATAEKVWKLIPSAAVSAYQRLTAGEGTATRTHGASTTR